MKATEQWLSPHGSGNFLAALLLEFALSVGPVRVDIRCRRRFCLEALFAAAGVADVGVVLWVWPGRRFVALEGEEDGC